MQLGNLEAVLVYLDFFFRHGLARSWLIASLPFLLLLLVAGLIPAAGAPRLKPRARGYWATLRATALSLAAATGVLVAIHVSLVLQLAPLQNPVGWKHALGDPRYLGSMLFMGPAVHLLALSFLGFHRSDLPALRARTRVAVGGLLLATVFFIGLKLWLGVSSDGPPGTLPGNPADLVPPPDEAQLSNRAILNLAVAVVLVGPIAEEIFWRGLVLPLFERECGGMCAVLATAALFSTLHLTGGHFAWQNVGSALVLGVLSGVLFLRYRSLSICALVHGTWNLVVALVAFSA